MRRGPAAFTLLALLLCACSAPEPAVERARFLVFGTEVEVQIRGSDPDRTAIAFAELGAEFQRMHRDWHPWAPGALTRLNAALTTGSWVADVDADLLRLIEVSRSLEQRTGGRFNAGIGALVSLWGFHTSDYPITSPPPSAEAIRALSAKAPSLLELDIDGGRVRSPNPALQLDFSGIAKGMAGRLACERLAVLDLDDALINLGGDVVICAPGRPWRIAISDRGEGLLEVRSLSGPLAIFTSGNDQRWGEWQGERYAHILDPSTGQPVDHVMQATVIDRDPILADAAATALVVAGPDWKALASDLALDQVLVIDAEGQVHRAESPTTPGPPPD
ncbi:FAD:protein FMN transferase [Wenzhouxiangella marina]|uniref:FAD:protein FMN transferase n=1 Tax=Wenzhouxiangella marina TaxID=1579979 RepID=A0A0K0XZ38_9GAMM|nr:FAD:protein FMN transferase [Wenzhouxiangella marina]AKS42897.1 Putative thiamine biosynthesis lipoprotein ApbE [Wenzhouxiangella marina]MBB6087420.1 thiamine biosynthesis lipoprotein [Wenzhouxiangella marina]